jgi:purine-binding chemotaxis protein CheW
MEALNEMMSPSVKRATEGKYLTFLLDSQEYGIGILKVREIIGIMPITSVPRAPDFIKGVINLRGKVIPIVDLRLKFGMAKTEYNEHPCIIVVETAAASGQIILGIIVDAVSEVLNIKVDQIEDTPSFGTAFDTQCICGMAKSDEGVRTLLDIDRMFNAGEGTDFGKRSMN